MLYPPQAQRGQRSSVPDSLTLNDSPHSSQDRRSPSSFSRAGSRRLAFEHFFGGMSNLLDQPALGERYPCSGAAADDDVVVQVQVQESRGIRELPRQAQVLTRRRRVAARVVVDQDDAGRALPEGWSQDLA